jgi:hypothetical protein
VSTENFDRVLTAESSNPKAITLEFITFHAVEMLSMTRAVGTGFLL